MSTNGVTIHCLDKCKIIKNSEQKEVRLEREGVVTLPYFVSMTCAQRLLRKDYKGYLCNVLLSLSKDSSVADIPIVHKFSKVFPKELLRTPVDKEIEFLIECMPGTQSIFKVPYGSFRVKRIKVATARVIGQGIYKT